MSIRYLRQRVVAWSREFNEDIGEWETIPVCPGVDVGDVTSRKIQKVDFALVFPDGTIEWGGVQIDDVEEIATELSEEMAISIEDERRTSEEGAKP